MDTNTHDWLQKVVELTRRLIELEAERDRVMDQLVQLRGESGSSAAIVPAPTPRKPRHEEAIFTAPGGGVSKLVYDYITAHPGIEFSTDQMTSALGLDESKRPSVNTAMSRLARAKVVERSGFGRYIAALPAADNPSEDQLPTGGTETQID